MLETHSDVAEQLEAKKKVDSPQITATTTATTTMEKKEVPDLSQAQLQAQSEKKEIPAGSDEGAADDSERISEKAEIDKVTIDASKEKVPEEAKKETQDHSSKQVKAGAPTAVVQPQQAEEIHENERTLEKAALGQQINKAIVLLDKQLQVLKDTNGISGLEATRRIAAYDVLKAMVRSYNNLMARCESLVKGEADIEVEFPGIGALYNKVALTQGYVVIFETMTMESKSRSLLHYARSKQMNQIHFEDESEQIYSEEKTNQIMELDRWLIEKISSDSDVMSRRMVFGFLNRSIREKALVYHMLSIGKESSVDGIDIMNSQINTTFNVEAVKNKLSRSKLHFIDRARGKVLNINTLSRCIQVANKSQEQIKIYRDMRARQDDAGMPQDNPANQFLYAVSQFTRILNTKDVSQESLQRAGVQMAATLEEIEAALQNLMSTRRADVEGQLDGEKLNDDLSEEKLGHIIRAVSTLKAGLGGVTGGMAFKLADLKVASASAEAAGLPHEDIDNQLKKLNSQVGWIGIAGNTVGLIAGGLTLVSGIAGLKKTLSNYDNLSAFSFTTGVLGSANSTVQGVNSILGSVGGGLSSISKLEQIGEKAATNLAQVGTGFSYVSAGVSILSGAATFGLGTAKYVHSIRENRYATEAESRFDSLSRTKIADLRLHGGPTDVDPYRYEKNVIKLERRFQRRQKVTAASQMLSGACTTAAGISSIVGLVSVASAPVAGVVGVGLSLAGLGITAGSSIITRMMRHYSYSDAIDEYFGIDVDMVKEWTGLTTVTKDDMKKYRGPLRKELMSTLGYTSEKAYYKKIMEEYAALIHDKLNNASAEERPAYEELLHSFDLKVDLTRGLPTEAMIFTKLMK